MTDPEAAASTVNSLIDMIDRTKDYFTGYRPDMKAVTYDYANRSSEMKLKIVVPDGHNRATGKVEIPMQQGYRLKEILAGGFDPVTTATSTKDGSWVIDPGDLPSHEEYMVVLEKENMELNELEKVVKIKPSSQPKSKNGVDTYWLESFIQEPKLFADIYDELKVENVDLDIQVGVQRCFSSAIPEDVIRGFKRTSELIEASDSGDFFEVKRAHKLRKGTLDFSTMNEQEIARLIRSLASSEHINDYITVESPYRRQSVAPESYQEAVLPETVQVNVSTNLSLDNEAAHGELKFNKEEYTQHLEEEVGELTED